MITIPKLSERDIRAFVSEQNLVNGKQYVRNGAIFDARQHGTTLRASCRGSVRTELLAFFQKSQNISLLIEIALDEDRVDAAIELLQSEQRPSGSVAIDVARAAEESRPLKAIEIYTQYIARLIEGRGRGNYNQACEYLKDVRSIYQKLGKQDLWANYIAKLREQNMNLPALKDEMAKAKL